MDIKRRNAIALKYLQFVAMQPDAEFRSPEGTRASYAHFDRHKIGRSELHSLLSPSAMSRLGLNLPIEEGRAEEIAWAVVLFETSQQNGSAVEPDESLVFDLSKGTEVPADEMYKFMKLVIEASAR